MADSESRKKCRESAMRLLARRDHSIYELRQKLSQRSFEGDDIEIVVAQCIERGWLDDHRFAEGLFRYRKNAGYGPYYIKNALASKGVERDVITEVMNDNEQDWLALATETARSSVRSGTIDEDWGRLSRKLQRRGYESQVVIKALNNVRAEQDEILDD